MAAGTVGYTDTRGNKDYTSMIAKSIGNRLKQASNMASEERAYAAGQAEAGGTSLEEAGIGKGYFFGRALGSRFGGDRICLLYTSPSPRDATLSRMPSSA